MTDPSNERTEPAGAIILAGGLSSRLGFDKRSLLVDGVPIVDHVYAALRQRFAQILIGAEAPSMWAHLDAEVVGDDVPGIGPLMGLRSCLARARHDLNFVTACDIPRPRMDLVERLLEAASTRDGAVPVTSRGEIEPLFGAYRRALLPTIDRLLSAGARSLRALYAEHDFGFVELASFGIDALPNINTPRDLERLKALLARTG